MDDRAIPGQGHALDDLVIPVRGERRILTHQEWEEIDEVLGQKLAGIGRQAGGRLVKPAIFTPLCSTTLSASVSSQLPPLAAAMSMITDPGFMLSTMAW